METNGSRLFNKTMKIIGLTGGIGSGKTKILNVFKAKGIPCYESDLESKKLIESNLFLISEIKKIFGSDIYLNTKLDREKVADIVFNSPEKLRQLNALVHPAVAADFNKFVIRKKSYYVIKEAAILFETGGYKKCNTTILVTSPMETRISRVMKRDNISREKLLMRINNQWEDKLKIPLADFVINNTNWVNTLIEIEAIHKNLIKM